jgi:hypothetical protein
MIIIYSYSVYTTPWSSLISKELPSVRSGRVNVNTLLRLVGITFCEMVLPKLSLTDTSIKVAFTPGITEIVSFVASTSVFPCPKLSPDLITIVCPALTN